MDALYLICLLVGGFFVLLSIFGGGDSEADIDAEFDADLDADFDADADADPELDAEADPGAGPGFIDLLSVRALFLFAAFFGLTGTLLSLIDSGEPLTLMLSLLTGLVVGLGGNYFIKRVGYAHVSSDVTASDLQGATARVLVPFEGERRGKISLVAKGRRMNLLARGFGGEAIESYGPGDEVVVVRMEGAVAEVVKPD